MSNNEPNCFNKLDSDLPKNLDCCPFYPKVANNSSNFYRKANWNNSYKLPGYLPETSGNVTTVGTNGTSSYYGTYDQTGNVSEINDAIISVEATGDRRGRRGGSWASDNIILLNKDFRDDIIVSGFYPSEESNAEYSSYIGFRLSTTGDPLSYNTNNNKFLSVGNTGNFADSTGYGQVNYHYKIMKYPVTNGEYVNFLNAVDPSGLNNRYLYSEEGAGWIYGGIQKTGVYPTPYSSKIYMYNKPVNYVSWFDAARFANWLHNKVDDANISGDPATEDGAYTLNGAMSGVIQSNSGARYRIPTEDEWYKAAYYNGSGYFAYATQSNILPTEVSSDTYGNGVGSDPLPTPSTTASATKTPTVTPSVTPTLTLTQTNTATVTVTPTITPTNSPTPSITPSNTPTPSVTATISPTPTITPSITPTKTVTPTISPTQTVTPTVSPTNTVTPTVSPTSSLTPSITPSITPTITPTTSITPTPTVSPTTTATATVTPSITPSNTPTPSITPSNSPTPSITPSNTLTPSITPTVTETPTVTPTPTKTPTPTTTPTITPTSSVIPSSPHTQLLFRTGSLSPTEDRRVVRIVIVNPLPETVIVEWGDGQVEYASPGFSGHIYEHRYTYYNQEYLVTIKGVFSTIVFNNTDISTPTAPERLVKILSWGTTAPISSFRCGGCTNLTHVPNILPSNITSLSLTFTNCRSLVNLDLSSWDMTSITTTKYMFRDCINLKTIGSPNWNTPYLKDTEGMFHGCGNFQDTIDMNMSNVQVTKDMFKGCSKFNHNINSWDVSNVTNMNSMFYGASSFNNPLHSWNTSKVTDMTYIFYDAYSFNQDISSWTFIRCFNLDILGGVTPAQLNTNYYDGLLNNWNNNKALFPTNAMIANAAGCRPSSAGQIFKSSLISYGWTITDAEGT